MDLNLGNVSADRSTGGLDEERVKVLILGSGPAGLSAALYAARADLNPVVLSGMELGGQVSLTYTVENYPGFPEGISGSDLSNHMRKQAEPFGLKFRSQEVL